MPSVETYLANYEDPVHAKAVVDLLDGYARDPYGNSGPLPDDVYASLCPTLAKTPGAFSVVATVDGVAAGLINCFQGFSTFKCKPLINVHDVFVHPEHRRAGLVQAMMADRGEGGKREGSVQAHAGGAVQQRAGERVVREVRVQKLRAGPGAGARGVLGTDVLTGL